MKYQINLLNPNAHLVSITLEFTSPWESPILEMPAWTPGSYLIRDYSRHVQNLEGVTKEGKEIRIDKIAKNRWKLDVSKDKMVSILYKVYAFELTVRTSYFGDRKVLLTPSSLFFYISNLDHSLDTKNNSLTLEFNILDQWEIFTSLKPSAGGYLANNFDELVDSPIVGGHRDVLDIARYTFDDSGNSVPNTVIIVGDRGNHNIETFCDDLQKIQSHAIEMFGELPYDRYYWFLFIVGKGGGGLEHKYSNCSIISRWSFVDPLKYSRLLSLEAHEHFHTYNIKRIRPKQLGPFEYNREVYTKLLWLAEGFTSFYDNIILPRTGLISHEEYWKIIAKDLMQLKETPGRFVRSLAESSFDAWIKFYKPDENSINSNVSYYLKGGLMALLLDLEIRNQSGFKKSLDDFYRYMYTQYKIDPNIGFEEAEMLSLLEISTKCTLSEFWIDYIEGTKELDFDHYLNLIGYEIVETLSDLPDWGMRFAKNNPHLVTNVLTDSPAMFAGIFVNDEILAINNFKYSQNLIKQIFDDKKYTKTLDIHLFRDGKLLTKQVNVEKAKLKEIEIRSLVDLTINQIESRNKFFATSYVKNSK